MRKQKWLSLLICAAMVIMMLPATAWAADNVSYLDANGASQTCATATEVTAEYLESTSYTLSTGWYVVTGAVTIDTEETSQRVTVRGDVHLILADGCDFTVSGGISVNEGNSLTVYGQSSGSTMGKLTTQKVSNRNAGIGSDNENNCGTIIINGGNVTANGGYFAAGIGSGTKGNCGSITINGGSVTAKSPNQGAGIGSGQNSPAGGSITINGGYVEAIGGGLSAGIGTGVISYECSITITGGTINATGGNNGAGIGGGNNNGGDPNYGAGGTITISGGTVTATGGTNSAGIGGGSRGTGGTITISGGTVTATGGTEGAGIGDGSGGSGGTFATGADGSAVIFASSISDTSGKDSSSWSGIIFEGDSGTVYGDQTLNTDLTIAEGKTLTVPADTTLTNAAGSTLTNNGTLTNSGTISNLGTINGEVINNGTLSNSGTINGTVTGNQPIIGAKYLDKNGEEQTAVCDGVITSENIGSYGTLNSGWYVVKGTVTADSRITVSGTVHLILADGYTLTASKGIGVSPGNSLTIYGQSAGTGTLTATGREGTNYGSAGIGGTGSANGGTITINGGTINATGGTSKYYGGAGIGGGGGYSGGIITINGGTVHATGGTTVYSGAGIGGGGMGSADNITINGGTVTAIGGVAFSVRPTVNTGLKTSAGASESALTSVVIADLTDATYTGNKAVKTEICTTHECDTAVYIDVDTHTATCKWCGNVSVEPHSLDENSQCTGCGICLVDYLAADGSQKAVACDRIITTDNIGSYGTLSSGWYVVRGTVTASSRINVSGTVHLILADGCNFTVSGGISVNKGNSLTIYGQSISASTMGKLTATGGDYQAGIGGDDAKNCGTVTINGGTIKATGGNYGAGIGGGRYSNSGTITINGGSVTATSTSNGAGIGSGGSCSGGGGTITINGGYVEAKGGSSGAGIGTGIKSSGGTITITGGTIKATGSSSSAGIGGGSNYGGTDPAIGSGGTITITGGNVTSNGGYRGAGIGGGSNGSGGTVTITGGTVTATGGKGGVGIGPGIDGSGGTVTLKGGTVLSVGGTNGKAYSSAPALEKGMRVSVGGSASNLAGVERTSLADATYTGNLAVKTEICSTHENTAVYIDADTHTATCKWCGNVSVEPHSLDENGQCTGCGIWRVSYLAADGSGQTAYCVAVTAETTALNTTGDSSGWYVVKGEVTASNRITVSGDVHLILADGCDLRANAGIQVQDDDNDPTTASPNALTIYGQTAGTGKLTANVTTAGDAAIGGNNMGSGGGNITINGGTIEATSTNGAGIGGGYGISPGGSGGNITINGGTVTANSTSQGTGIGGGGAPTTGGSGGNITINGGTVTATGAGGAGIGGGYGNSSGGSGGSVIITGGIVKATSSDGAGIGGGLSGYSGTVKSDGTTTISGGTVTAIGKVAFSVRPTVNTGLKTSAGASESALTSVVIADLTDATYTGNKAVKTEICTIHEFDTAVYKDADNHTLTCKWCGTESQEAHSFVGNGDCVCGAAKVNYLDEHGTEQTAVCQGVKADNIGSYGTLTTGWYVVKGDVTASSRITVSGEVHLILADGCDFTVTGGIGVNESNSLTIYAQSTNENTIGKLTATGGAWAAGIGGREFGAGGNITINGGIVNATGGSFGAGIGGDGSDSNGNNGGTVTINGGTVIATGGIYAAGIGGGAGGIDVGRYTGGSGANVTINGGTVIATSKKTVMNTYAPGIGGGIGNTTGGAGGSLIVTGGYVVANGIGGAGSKNGNSPGANGTFSVSGNSVVISDYIKDQTQKNSWSGIVFEGNEGTVYGTSVTPTVDFTIESGKSLLIPTGSALNISGINAVNNGSVYVNGTLSGALSGSGSYYYPLTVTGGTADKTYDYNSSTYGKEGETITLTGTDVPVGQAVSGWTASDAAVTVVNNAFTMPAKALTVSRDGFVNAPTYTVTIPATVELGGTATVSASGVNVVSGSSLVVTLTDAQSFKLTTDEGAELSYGITKDSTPLSAGSTVLTVAGGIANNTGSAVLTFSAPTTALQYSGVYKGTVTFTVAVTGP